MGALPILGKAPEWLLMAVGMVAFAGVILGLASVIAGVTSWIERRIAGRMQSRYGPNRVGPQGSLQWVADGLKCFFKEDLTPALADKPLFRIAPYIVFAGMFAAWAVFPYSQSIVASDLDVGILYIMAITSLVVIGILMGGWSSNNKWSIYGALRSSAQIVSYEVPAGIAILTVVLLTGSLRMQTIVESQSGPFGILGWNVFNNPFVFVAFIIYFVSATAEGNRTPFDLPEAESELVAGYNTEYSGMRFVMFFFAEWANLFVIGVVTSALFFGGWQGPLLPGVVWFFIKASAFVFLLIWLRWTLPRLRVDQLMGMCWKYLTPIALVCLVGTMVWMILLPGRKFFGLIG